MSERGKERKRLYDVAVAEEVRRRGSDPLEEAIADEDRELAREAKRKRLEEIVLEREAKIKELKSRLEGAGGTPNEGAPLTSGSVVATLIKGGVEPKVANEWLESLSPEALGALIALQSNNPTLAMMAFAMGQQRGQPITVKDVIELNKVQRESGIQPNITLDIAKIIEAVTSAGKAGPEINPKEIVDSTVEAIKTGIQLAPKPAAKEESWFEKLMGTPEGVGTAKDIGLLGGNIETLKIMKEMKESDRKFLREMKESDRRFQMQLARMRVEERRKWAEMQEGRKRTEIIGGALKRVGSAIARAVSETEEEEGEEKEETKPAKKEGKVKGYACSECGATISIPPDAKVGSYVECAKCGERYELTSSHE